MNPTQFVTNAQASRRDLVKYLTGVGLGSLAAGSLLGGEALAQDTMTLAFDAAATGGGGGRPNATKAQFCWVVNGGNQFEINRMVDARLVTVSSDLSEVVGDLADS